MSALEVIPISHFVCNARQVEPEQGSESGTCCKCLRETEQGHATKLPKTFTSWTYFQDVSDPVVCPACQHMLKERKYRSSCWLATADSFEFVKLRGVRDILEDIPEPPWALYSTLSYKKHGWLNTQVNYSRESFYLTVDYSCTLVRREEIEEITRKIRRACQHIDRWHWIQQEVGVHEETSLWMSDPDLYDWWKAHRFQELTLFLLRVMIPTKKELRELEEQGEGAEMKLGQEETKKRSPQLTLDDLLGIGGA